MANYCERLADAAARFADRTAVEVQGDAGLLTVSYRALADQAAAGAAALAARGVRRGDRVAILADNSADWVAAYFGILRLAAVAVPLDTAYRAPQIAAVAESCEPRVVLTTPAYETYAREGASGAGDGAPSVVLLSELSAAAPPPGDRPAGNGAGRRPPPGPAEPAAIAEAAASDPAVLLYTSGTTSDPKGVVLTHGNLDAERAAVLARIPVAETDALLGVLPLFHALAQMANLLLPLAVGARVVFLEHASSATLLQALQERDITLFACVPQFFYLIHHRVLAEVGHASRPRQALFRALLRTNGWCRARLGWNPGRRWFARVHHAFGPRMRVLITGGSKFDPAIGRDLYDLGLTLVNAYGLTECSGAATMERPEDGYSTTVGPPLAGVEVRIAPRPHEADADVPDGEVLLRGPIVMAGYYRRPDATSDALDAEGWLHTGDLGVLDGRGRLAITGRLKEIIVLASGKNIYPEDIEAHYRQSAFVKELCVLGVTRAREPAAERLHAVIVPDADALKARGAVNVRELIRFELESLSVTLPSYKRVLSYDIVVDPLPRTTTGKLRRHEIARQRAARERQAAAAAPRALSDDERRWMADPDNAASAALIAERSGRAAVAPDANLELDLDLDSMERVELLTVLEQRAGREVPAETRASIFTVRQLVEAVRAGRRAGEAGAAEPSAPWPALLAAPVDAALEANLRRSKGVRAVLAFLVLRGAAAAARALVGWRVTGAERVPDTGAFIVSPNHQSYLDGVVVAAALPLHAFRRIFFVGAAEYFQTPFMRWLARAINVVPVDPDANLVSAMQASAAGLRAGKVLILFPEGERSIDGRIKPFRKGAAILASTLNVAVVPTTLDGLFVLWPRGRRFHWTGLLPWRATPVRVAFGEPLALRGDDYAAGTERLQRAVEAGVEG